MATPHRADSSGASPNTTVFLETALNYVINEEMSEVCVPAKKQICHELLKFLPLHHLIPPTKDLLAKTARGVFQVDLVEQLSLCLSKVDRVQFDTFNTLFGYFSQQFTKYTSLDNLCISGKISNICLDSASLVLPLWECMASQSE